jgi:hypothetical protein
MTKEQVNEAIEQMKIQCDLKMANYELVSARGTLYELGYNREDTDQVISAIYEGGFTYCLDPELPATHYDPDNPKAIKGMVTDYASADACHWGPDQLKSRLEFLRW